MFLKICVLFYVEFDDIKSLVSKELTSFISYLTKSNLEFVSLEWDIRTRDALGMYKTMFLGLWDYGKEENYPNLISYIAFEKKLDLNGSTYSKTL